MYVCFVIVALLTSEEEANNHVISLNPSEASLTFYYLTVIAVHVKGCYLCISYFCSLLWLHSDFSQELIDKLHRQARVEEEVKHVLKAYYKHRDIDKEEYKSILRRAVPQVCHRHPHVNLD